MVGDGGGLRDFLEGVGGSNEDSYATIFGGTDNVGFAEAGDVAASTGATADQRKEPGGAARRVIQRQPIAVDITKLKRDANTGVYVAKPEELGVLNPAAQFGGVWQRAVEATTQLLGQLSSVHGAEAVDSVLADQQRFGSYIGQHLQTSAGIDATMVAAMLPYLYDEVAYLGIFEQFLAIKGVEDIIVPNHTCIELVLQGEIVRVMPTPWPNAEAFSHFCERIASLFLRSELNEAQPLVEKELTHVQGRIELIGPPISGSEPTFVIRRPQPERFTSLDDYIKSGIAPPEFFTFLKERIVARDSVLVSGAVGSGKTTMLNALASFIPPWERILTIEDTKELQIRHPRVQGLYTRERDPNVVEQTKRMQNFDMSRLLMVALRVRPDRIIVGEVRGKEAFDMLRIMTTGHPGMCTIHAESATIAIDRLRQACADSPSRANLSHEDLTRMIASNIRIVVHIARIGKENKRRVVEVEEIICPPLVSDPKRREFASTIGRPLDSSGTLLRVHTLFKYSLKEDRLVRVGRYFIHEY